MNCPTCNIPLLISERQGIEIDYCQKCRGVWLDRGELDKLIERAGASYPTQGNRQEAEEDEYQKQPEASKRGEFGMGQRRERENPIGELFDFF